MNPEMRDLPKHYDPHAVESEIYRRWEEGDYFRPEVNPAGEPFTIIMPPPNANEPLHIGHALTMTVEDILTRHARMRGKAALWLPGADHAGIETQVVYERKLADEGKSRFDFQREQLYQDIYDYVQSNKSIMESQLRRLGCSCDWSRERFTLDPEIIQTVYQTFKRLQDDGLVYRGERIVNYCTHHGTSFSDLEVEHVERSDSLYTVRYRVKGSDNYLEIATTRPETIPGDVAVAVHPDDDRYRHLVGEAAIVPLGGREVPIIADPAVDPDFGTGAVKVTPAHDPLDFEIGERHRLPLVHVVGTDGTLKNSGPELDGLTVGEGRAKAVELLGEMITQAEDLTHSVGVCYKCGTVIEPLALEQWWVKTTDPRLSGPAIQAVKQGSISFVPARFERTFHQWIENLRDWNIVRQNVWGIRVPAWHCEQGHWTVTAGETPPSCVDCGSTRLEQDTDVFDTWFSSGQWPFATLGHPDGEDFKRFYPTSVMETGYDILFFWVARMIMLGLYVTGEVPFRTVYLHGMVRDEKGAKISKSKGNVIDPMEVIEKHGTDALRAGLILSSPPGRDIALSWSQIEEGQHFANKFWNVARFVLAQQEVEGEPRSHDKWILARLDRTMGRVDHHLEKFRLDLALDTLYHFIWDDVADWYVEASKERAHKETLRYVLETSLKLLHPFMPFITEEIWSHLGHAEPLIVTKWPDAEGKWKMLASEEEFEKTRQKILSERAASAVAEEKAGLEKYVAELRDRLANPSFKEKASPEAVRAAEEKLQAAEARLRELE
jgi:valyl-tRNA synthetase